jgi:hypothetical protein
VKARTPEKILEGYILLEKGHCIVSMASAPVLIVLMYGPHILLIFQWWLLSWSFLVLIGLLIKKIDELIYFMENKVHLGETQNLTKIF